MTALDRIKIDDIQLEAIIGRHPNERVAPQALRLKVLIDLDARAAGVYEDISKTVDYSALLHQIRFVFQYSEFILLEAACEAAAGLILLYWGRKRGVPIVSVCIEAAKPQALAGQGVPTVSVTRNLKDLATAEEVTKFGRVDIVHETDRMGLYLLHVGAGMSIQSHFHKQTTEIEMALDEGLLLQRQPLPANQVRRWPLGHVHRYDNPGKESLTIACIDRPRFDPSDEVETADPERFEAIEEEK